MLTIIIHTKRNIRTTQLYSCTFCKQERSSPSCHEFYPAVPSKVQQEDERAHAVALHQHSDGELRLRPDSNSIQVDYVGLAIHREAEEDYKSVVASQNMMYRIYLWSLYLVGEKVHEEMFHPCRPSLRQV